MNKYKMYQKPNFFRRNFSFAGTMGAADFWSELGIRVIGLLCAAIILCILIVLVVPGDTEQLIEIVDMVMPFLAIIWMIPIIAMTRRRLRDAGHSAKSYLWLLIPAIGLIIFVVLLCGKSTQ